MPRSASASVRPLYAVALKLLSSMPPVSVISHPDIPTPGLAAPVGLAPSSLLCAHPAAISANSPKTATNRASFVISPSSLPFSTNHTQAPFQADGPISLRTEQPVPEVAEARQDISAVVQLPVDRGGEDRDIRVFGLHLADSLGRGDDAHEPDRRRAAAPDPPVASIGSSTSTWRSATCGNFR